jgi:Aminoglycoside-2''-adenylyltransferase
MNAIPTAGFEPVHAVASLLSGLTVPWWITGGWAIDLAVGHVTRGHANVNIMMLERDEHALRELTGVDIQHTVGGQPPGPWTIATRLTALPDPGPNPGPKGGPGRPIGPDRLVLRGENLPLPAEVIPASAVGSIWVYKKGSNVFTRPLAEITCHWQGIPFLAPEVVLLIKARPGLGRPRTDNDQHDFESALPLLSAEQRSWLRNAIERPSWLKDAVEGTPRPPREHQWAAELSAAPH